MNCQDNSRLKVPLPEVCNTTDIGCVPLTSGKPRCAPEPDQLPLAYDPGDGTLWVFQCDTRQWISLGGSFSLSDLDEVNLDNITNICNILKIPVFYNPGVGTIQGSVSLAEFSEQLLKCVRLERRVAILAEGKVEFSVPGINGLDPVYVKYEGLTVSGEGSASNPLVVKAEAPPQESPCSYPEKNQAQVDAATSVKLIACVDNEKARIPYPEIPEGESVCSAPRRTLAQALAAGEKDLIACIDGIVVRIPLNEILEYKGDDTMDGICGFPVATLANLPDSTTIGVCANGQSYQFRPDPVVFHGIPAVTIGAPSGNTPPAAGQVPFRTDGTTLWVWNGTEWVAINGGGSDPGADYLLKSEAASTYETQTHAEATYLKIADAPTPQDLTAYLKKTDASKTYATKKELGQIQTQAFDSTYGMLGRYIKENRTISIDVTNVELFNVDDENTGSNVKSGIAVYALHNSSFVKGQGTKNVVRVTVDGTERDGTYTTGSDFEKVVSHEFSNGATVVAQPWVNMVENTRVNPKYYLTAIAVVTDDPAKSDQNILTTTASGLGLAGPDNTMAIASSQNLYVAPSYIYGQNNRPRNGVTILSPKGTIFSLDAEGAGSTKTLYLRTYFVVYWPDVNDLLINGTNQFNSPQTITRTLAGGANINIYAA